MDLARRVHQLLRPVVGAFVFIYLQSWVMSSCRTGG